MKERIVTVLDGPLDGRRMAVKSNTFSGVEAPPMTAALMKAEMEDVIRFQETVYEVVEIRRDVFVGVPRSWIDDENRHQYRDLFDRICARLVRGYVGERA